MEQMTLFELEDESSLVIVVEELEVLSPWHKCSGEWGWPILLIVGGM